MRKMKNTYIKGNAGKKEFMNEITWNKLPDTILNQLNMLGIKDAKTYAASNYRISLEPALSNFSIKLIIGAFIITMYVGLINGAFGHIQDMTSTFARLGFVFAYFFSLFTIVNVYQTHYEEYWKRYVVEINRYSREYLEADMGAEDEE